MSLASHHLFASSPPSSRLTLHQPINLRNLKGFCISPPINSRYPIHISHKTPFNFIHKFKFYHSLKPSNCHNASITQQTHKSSYFDSLLSISELVCLFSSTIIAIGYVANYSIFGLKNTLLGLIGNRVLAFGVVVLVCGVWIGAYIRRRQWKRICWEKVRGEGRESVNLVERIEKLEEDLKSYATIIRVLSRQLEKLGIRFRVTRKALKEPITEEQQQKQLELILAIGKTGKLFESKQEPSQQQDTFDASNLIDRTKQIETHETEALGSSRGGNNDRT